MLRFVALLLTLLMATTLALSAAAADDQAVSAKPSLAVIGRAPDFTLFTVTNLAARLCGEAAPGQILISRRVLTSVEDLVQADSVGEGELKGFSKPVSTFNIVGLKP